MIGYVKGKVTGLYSSFCFLETGGIGYRIFISDKTRQHLSMNEEAKLLTHMVVREDAILLYGFLTPEEKELFLILIGIPKVGPKVAMGILSALDFVQLVTAVKTKNAAPLTQVPGIGKKTAERLIVELKDKVDGFDVQVSEEELAAVSPAEEGMEGDALKALMSLGYESSEVMPVIRKLSGFHDNVSALISAVLRELARGRD